MWRSGLLVVLLMLLAGAGPAGASQVSPSGRGGGIDGGLPDTTNGDDAPTVTSPPATTTAAAPATTATTTPAVTATSPATTAAPAVATTVAAAPAPAAPTSVAPAPVPSTAVSPTIGAGEGQQAGAGLDAASPTRSSEAIRSPALLVAGLALALLGGAVLILRSRRGPGGNYS